MSDKDASNMKEKLEADLDANKILIAYFESLFTKIQKLMDDDPEGFAYIALGALAGTGVAVATGGASLGISLVGTATGAIVGLTALGIKRAFWPVDLLKAEEEAETMAKLLKRASNRAPAFCEHQIKTLGKISSDLNVLGNGKYREVDAVKLKNRINSVTKRIDSRMNLFDEVDSLEDWESEMWSIKKIDNKFFQKSKNDLENIKKLVAKLENENILMKEADILKKDIKSWKNRLSRKISDNFPS